MDNGLTSAMIDYKDCICKDFIDRIAWMESLLFKMDMGN